MTGTLAQNTVHFNQRCFKKNIMTDKQNTRFLLWERAFWPLCCAQFFGAFNDNFFKNALVILITFQSLSFAGLSPEKLIALCGGIFIFPFFLFSSLAGQIADKYEKSRLLIYIKTLEIGIMSLAVMGFMAQSLWILLVALFLMGFQSALFSPLKYSYVPQKLGHKRLPVANAFLQSSTFLAILMGTLAGGLMVAVPEQGIKYVCVSIIVFAVVGFLFSLFILKASPSEPKLCLKYNPFVSTYRLIYYVLAKAPIRFTVLCLAYFWFYGLALLSLLPVYGKKILGGNEQVVAFLLTLFSVGVGLGCLISALWHKGEQWIRTKTSSPSLKGKTFRFPAGGALALSGALGLSLFVLDLFWQSRSLSSKPAGQLSFADFIQNPEHFRIMFDLIMMAVSGGVFFVPLMTFLQKSAPKDHISRVIAGSNICEAFFMVLSALFLIVLFTIGLKELHAFFCLGLLSLMVFVLMLFYGRNI